MAQRHTHPEINERLVNATAAALEDALETARRADPAVATVTLPATAIHGLLGMLRESIDDEFWYRRRQFIVFYAKLVLAEAQQESAR